MKKFRKISDKEFSDTVSNNYCIRDIVESLGYSRSSGSMAIKVKERIKSLNLDTSHLRGRGAKEISRPTYSLDEILIENSKYENRDRLKKRIVKAGLIKYECSECGNTGEWNGKSLTLQLEHKNGVSNDNRIENLTFLCPNCHSQTDTYSGRNSGTYSI